MPSLILQDVVIFLVTAGIVIPLFKRFRVSPVLGFLLVGLAVGPHGLARLREQWPWLDRIVITDSAGLAIFAELGVVFLLFMIGLELSVSRLWRSRRMVFGFGSAQIVVCAIAVGLIAWLFGNSPSSSLVIGGALALSSTAIVLQLLQEQGRFATPVGYASFSLLLAQDIAVVPLLFLVGALAAGSGGSPVASLFLALLQAGGTVVVIMLIGRRVIRPFLHFISEARNPEIFVAGALLVIVASALVTHAAGLSAALGAFLAGLLFAETEYKHEIEVNIEPFKGLLLGLFFMSVGMGLDLGAILDDPLWIGLSIAGLLIIKTLIITALALLVGMRFNQAIEVGLLLSQAGEFAFVVIGLAQSFALMDASIAQFMLLVVSATMLLTPGLARLARALGARLSEGSAQSHATVEIASDLTEHVILVGYGRTGRLLADILNAQCIPYVALDLNTAHVAQQRAAGMPVFVGDASRRAMLEKVRYHEACSLIVSTDDASAAEQILHAARQLSNEVPILVRATDQEHARILIEQGATATVSEVLESSLQLARLMLRAVGLTEEAAREVVQEQRALRGEEGLL